MEKSHRQDLNLQPTAWASNSGKVKDRLDHSATGHYIFLQVLQRSLPANIQGSHTKNLPRFEPATLTSAVCYCNHSVNETCYIMGWNNDLKIKVEQLHNQTKFEKCSFWAGYIAENKSHMRHSNCSVVAAWNGDKKDGGSNLLSVLLFFLLI